MAVFSFRPKLLTCLKTYDLPTFKQDLLAGVAVGAVALPLAIAFAIASGLKPADGLVTAIVAGFITSFFGGSRVAIGGPTGAFVVIILGVVQQYGVANLLICTMMAGVMLFLLGAFRMGALINYIPFPLISGFTSGIAVLIISTQIKDFIGMPTPEGVDSGFISSVVHVLTHLNQVNTTTLILSVASFLALWLWPKKLARYVPGSIVVLIVATVVVTAFSLPVATIDSRFGAMPTGLPKIQAPEFNLATFQFLLGPAITIALLGAIESLLCAVVADGMIGDHHDPNQELMAQGLANFVTPFFGGLPATGAIARTATNIRTGGKTPVAGIVHAAVCLVILLAAAPLAGAVPLAVLSAILLMVGINMGQWKEFLRLKKYPKSDGAVLLTTFLLTVIFDLTVAVAVGMLLAALLFIKRMASQANIEVRPFTLQPSPAVVAAASVGGQSCEAATTNEILILNVHGEMFFGAAQKLQTVIDHLKERPKIIILKMKYVFSLDASSLVALSELAAAAKKHGTKMYFSGLTRQPLEAMKRSGLYDQLGAWAFFHDQSSAVEAACQALGLGQNAAPDDSKPADSKPA